MGDIIGKGRCLGEHRPRAASPQAFIHSPDVTVRDPLLPNPDPRFGVHVVGSICVLAYRADT